MMTNSRFLLDQENVIVPFLAHEGLTDKGRDPSDLFFVPFVDNDSFNVAGRMHETYTELWVLLNSRYLFDAAWDDKRDELGTLTHELIHAQGYLFTFPEIVLYDSEDRLRADLEARTSAATIEVLASMCRMGDSLACKTFWLNVHDMARGALRYRMNVGGYDYLYNSIANTLWRDSVHREIAQKRNEYYAVHQDELLGMLRNYSAKPWDEHILGNVCHPTQMLTGNPKAPGLSFDDTVYLLGWVKGVVCAQ